MESYSALIYLNEEVVEPCQRHSTAFFTVTIIMVNGTFKPINAHIRRPEGGCWLGMIPAGGLLWPLRPVPGVRVKMPFKPR